MTTTTEFLRAFHALTVTKAFEKAVAYGTIPAAKSFTRISPADDGADTTGWGPGEYYDYAHGLLASEDARVCDPSGPAGYIKLAAGDYLFFGVAHVLPTRDATLEEIAAFEFGFTLETRNSDDLDFHEVSAWELKKALIAAYQAGAAAARGEVA